ncbi:MAG: substrate-binding domain-containing protein [Pseudomonadota bacterium]
MTLKELADLLGLSKTTVSRALAGYSDVNSRTRERVRNAAEQFGYQPNPIAQRLRSGRLNAVGLVIPSDLRPFGDAFFVDLVTNLSKKLVDHDLDLLLSAVDCGRAELLALRHLIEGRRVDGIIVSRTLRRDPRVDYLRDQNVPFVCYGRTEDAGDYAFVDMDGKAAGHAAVDALVALGHRDIAYIGPPSSRLTYAWHRRYGYTEALKERGLRPRTSLIREGDGGQVFGERATIRLLEHEPRPTAMICATDLEAIGALRAIEMAGLMAGKDVSVIGHDDLPEAALTNPPLATLRQPHAAVGRRLAEIIAALIDGADPSDYREVWKAELIKRQSLGAAPTSLP